MKPAVSHKFANKGAVLISLPAIIKAHENSAGKRVLEVEASNEEVDDEGDVISQKALLDSAVSFIQTGHIDIDHISELGPRLGIANSESFIIGRPTEVRDLGGGRTSVVAEIRRSMDGSHDPIKNRFDAFWDTMISTPPVLWRASIYGFPTEDGVIDCRAESCDSGAKRYHITKMQWRSLAMTRNPVNTNITGYARIISAKAYIALLKSDPAAMYAADLSPPPEVPGFDMNNGKPFDQPNGAPKSELDSMVSPETFSASTSMPMPRNMADIIGSYHHHIKRDCVFSEGVNSTPGFKSHFENCCGMRPEMAEIAAHALMHHILLDRRRVS